MVFPVGISHIGYAVFTAGVSTLFFINSYKAFILLGVMSFLLIGISLYFLLDQFKINTLLRVISSIIPFLWGTFGFVTMFLFFNSNLFEMLIDQNKIYLLPNSSVFHNVPQLLCILFSIYFLISIRERSFFNYKGLFFLF